MDHRDIAMAIFDTLFWGLALFGTGRGAYRWWKKETKGVGAAAEQRMREKMETRRRQAVFDPGPGYVDLDVPPKATLT